MYTESTVFVPSTLLPIEIPADYETARGEYSVLIENAGDIRKFWEEAQLSAEEMGVGLIFSDGGWLEIEDSFEAAQAASMITTMLYIVGVGLALILAVYLYIGRNRQEYAIMRALGVPGKDAEIAVILSFAVLAVAMPIGGIAGLLQATKAATGALAELAGSLSDSYAPDAALPVWAVFLCIFSELAFTMLTVLVFLRRIKKRRPWNCLRGSKVWAGINSRFTENMKVTVRKGRYLHIVLVNYPVLQDLKWQNFPMPEKCRQAGIIGLHVMWLPISCAICGGGLERRRCLCSWQLCFCLALGCSSWQELHTVMQSNRLTSEGKLCSFLPNP